MASIDTTPGHGPNGDCWVWTRGKFHFGHGQIKWRGKSRPASQVAYECFMGAIPAGQQVNHSCDHPPCCRPDHLYLGTQQDNMRDKVARNRQAKGESCGRAKLTMAQVTEIRRRYVPKCSINGAKALAVEFGIRTANVYRIVRGETWKTD